MRLDMTGRIICLGMSSMTQLSQDCERAAAHVIAGTYFERRGERRARG
jgi:hypothetical protein